MNQIYSVQYLRGIAALMVVFVHIGIWLRRLGYEGDWPEFFKSGVDIFFVISGFIMWVTTFNSAMTPQQFIYRRLTRIVPLYWILTTLTVCVMLASPSLVQTWAFDFEHLVKSYLFLPAQHPVTKIMAPVLQQGWTLNYEMFFYCIFAGCLTLPARFRATSVLGLLCLFVSTQPLFPDQHAIISFYTDSIILEFGFGVIIGVYFTSGSAVKLPYTKMHTMMLIFIGVLGIGLSAFYTAPRLVQYGIPAALIVLGSVMFERGFSIKRYSSFLIFGDASYALYLSHGVVISAFGQVWRKLGLTGFPPNLIAFTLISLILVNVTAVFLYKTVERPLIESFRGAGFLGRLREGRFWPRSRRARSQS
jgi:exopolysaccharide production protein ExoZ